MNRYPEDTAEIRTRLLAGDALVACLCTERCHKCDDWWGDFDRLSKSFPAACFVWLDVDEHPDMAADIPGVAAFPFLLVRTDCVCLMRTVEPDHDRVAVLLNTHLNTATPPASPLPEPGLWTFLTE